MKQIILKILRFIPVFVLLIFLCLLNRSSFAYMNERTDYYISEKAANIIMCLSNALLYIFLLDNAVKHDINIDDKAEGTNSFGCIFKNPGFYISTTILILYDVLFSSSMSSRLSDALKNKSLSLLISIVFIVMLSFTLWFKNIKIYNASVDKKKQKIKYVILGYIIPSAVICTLVYFIPFIAVQANMILFFGKFILGGIAVILSVYLIVIYLNAFLKRKKFIIKLKDLCKEKGYKLSEIHRPFKSIFYDDGKISFTIQINDTITEHKLMSCLNKATNVFFFEEGGIIKDLPVKLGKKAVLFSFRNKKMIDSQKCYIIFTSSPNNALNGTANGKEYIDNSSVVGKLVYFTSTGYLNTLERELIK